MTRLIIWCIGVCCLATFGLALAAGAAEEPAVPAKEPAKVLHLSAAIAEAGKTGYALWRINELSEAIAIPEKSVLVYEIYLPKDNLQQSGGVEFEGEKMPALRDREDILDQDKQRVHASGEAMHKAAGTWYTRKFDLQPVAGSSFQTVSFFSAEIKDAKAGTYHAYVRNIRLEDAEGKLIRDLMPAATEKLIERSKFENMKDAAANLEADPLLQPAADAKPAAAAPAA